MVAHGVDGNSGRPRNAWLQTGALTWWPIRRWSPATRVAEAGRVLRGPHDDQARSDEALAGRRTRWFGFYMSRLNVVARSRVGPYSCPCCSHVTLAERGQYEICAECGWEDDGQDDHDSQVVRGGPNGRVSLDDARAAYVAGGGAPLRIILQAIPREDEGTS